MQKRTALLVATALAVPAAAALAFSGQVSGYYISLGAGGNFLQGQTIKSQAFPNYGVTNPVSGQQVKTDPGFLGVASAGYGFGNGLRIELQGDFRQNKVVGEFKTGPGDGHQSQYGGFVNGLYDFDIGYPPMTPYIGVGAGYEYSQFSNVNSLGLASNGVTPYYDHNQGGEGNFAAQVILGLAFDIDFLPGVSLTTEYRFMAMPFTQTYHTQVFEPGLATRDSIKTDGLYNHALLVGLRYEFDRSEPAPPETIPETPAAPVVQARSYLVFFDWDRAELTARARQIIAEAAQASSRVQVTRIEVNGYTDLSGTASYNQGLSVRRARSVQAELLRDGVPAGEISVHGYGESNPLVPTAKGVREAQNRRVEIIFH